MVKYTDTRVTFSEVPDEVTLCINISGCPCKCEGCHSAYLAEDVGNGLNPFVLGILVGKNYPGITCVSFMGGDAHPEEINELAKLLKQYGLKTAWYSGRQELSSSIDISNFDYIKLGPYIASNGPLDNPNTNQKMYKIKDGEMKDITYKFWKNDKA